MSCLYHLDLMLAGIKLSVDVILIFILLYTTRITTTRRVESNTYRYLQLARQVLKLSERMSFDVRDWQKMLIS